MTALFFTGPDQYKNNASRLFYAGQTASYVLRFELNLPSLSVSGFFPILRDAFAFAGRLIPPPFFYRVFMAFLPMLVRIVKFTAAVSANPAVGPFDHIIG